MRRVFIDTNVFIYALGGEHEYREPCRAILAGMRNRRLHVESGVEMVQEFVHLRARARCPADAVTQARRVMAACHRVHDFTRRELDVALELLGAHPTLRPRDAVHAATALNHGIDAVLSADRHFDVIPEIERIDPADKSAVAGLST